MITFRKFGKLGRFGNQLFQYAGVYNYAQKYDYTLAMPAWEGSHVFKNISHYTPKQKFKSYLLPIRQLDDMQSWNIWQRIKYTFGLQSKLPLTHSIENLYATPKDNINFYGYFQDEFSINLLNQKRHEIQELFTFKRHITQALDKEIQLHTPYVGVHIRRGDLTWRNLSVDPELYKEQLRKIVNGRKVYIASDDPKMVNKFKKFDVFKIIKPLNDLSWPILDFWMLTQAQTVIGGGSTFSWWAAFLNKNNDYYSPPLTHLWPKGYSPKFGKIEFNV